MLITKLRECINLILQIFVMYINSTLSNKNSFFARPYLNVRFERRQKCLKIKYLGKCCDQEEWSKWVVWEDMQRRTSSELFGWRHLWCYDELGMWLKYCGREVHTEFWWGNLSVNVHWKDQIRDGRITLRLCPTSRAILNLGDLLPQSYSGRLGFQFNPPPEMCVTAWEMFSDKAKLQKKYSAIKRATYRQKSWFCDSTWQTLFVDWFVATSWLHGLRHLTGKDYQLLWSPNAYHRVPTLHRILSHLSPVCIFVLLFLKYISYYPPIYV
jgi:hypothetical protein